MKVKSKELRNLGNKELQEKLLELKKGLVKMNAQVASGTVPENPGDVKNYKKGVAKIIAILNEKGKEEKLQDQK